MNNIRFTTNLDEAKRFMFDLSAKWPANCIPRVGERIELPLSNGKVFDLEVCSVTYQATSQPFMAVIELHMPSYYAKMSINAWSEWFKRHSK